MGGNVMLALGALLVGYNLGSTARKKGFIAAGAGLAATALSGYAVYRLMFPVTQNLINQTLGE